jgi:RecJ-like exonuclease
MEMTMAKIKTRTKSTEVKKPSVQAELKTPLVESEPRMGVMCPRCKVSGYSRVYRSVPVNNGIRRYRKCGYCDFTFTTEEKH